MNISRFTKEELRSEIEICGLEMNDVGEAMASEALTLYETLEALGADLLALVEALPDAESRRQLRTVLVKHGLG